MQTQAQRVCQCILRRIASATLSLHDLRHQEEQRVAQCEHLMDVMEDIHPIANRLQTKLRLMRLMSTSDFQFAAQQISGFERSDREE